MKKLLISVLLVFGLVSVYAQNNGYVSKVTEYIILQGDTIRLDTATIVDGQVIKRVAGVWTNSTGGAGSAAVDSLTWNFSNGYLGWYISGSVANSISLDGRYIEIADSAVSYVTPTQLANTLVDVQTVVYPITLSSSDNVSGKISGATVPLGWTLTASGVDMIVTHGLGRRVANVSICAVTGIGEQKLFNTAAYNGWITTDLNTLKIQSLGTLDKVFKVYIIFQ